MRYNSLGSLEFDGRPTTTLRAPMSFDLQSDFEPTGDQPQAIRELTEGIERGDRHQTLLGATGTGKTFTVSHVINNVDRPVLVMSHNKTLAAQLYSELSQFFPENAVEYFISYYDYYQPEAYVPTTDTYIEKDASINDEIERMRLSATSSLVSGRDDVIVVSSVSSIYGLGSPSDYKSQILQVEVGDRIERNDFLRGLVDILYERNDVDFSPGTFRVRGDAVEVLPAYFQDQAYQIEFWGDEIDRIRVVDPISGNVLSEEESVTIYPANHFVTPEEKLERAIDRIEEELKWRLAVLREEGKLVEAQRLEQRTLFDVEMMKEVGYCAGIENYARHLSGREQGERPYCLLDYFPDDYFVVIDESHVTVPQLRAMYNGDRQRKLTLVEHGFRLPSALDNRPLKFEEFQDLAPQTIYVSATPGDYELKQSGGVIVEQIVRPTGVLDPEVEVRPTEGQIDDLLDEIYERAQNEERTLVTTLTKRMAEDLTDYLRSYGVRVEYIHSDIDTVERVEILRNLRLGEYDVVVGVNLLREGLDLPEVSLVAIMDADKEGFLRSETSLIQTAGRAARNVNGTVVMYANRVTDAMQKMIDETERRREIQMEYNEEHDITPETIQKSVDQIKRGTAVADRKPAGRRDEYAYTGPEDLPQEINDPVLDQLSDEKKREMIDQLEEEMHEAADQLAFERAAELRDTIDELKESLPEYEPG